MSPSARDDRSSDGHAGDGSSDRPGPDGPRLVAAVEAMLFSHGTPASAERIAAALERDPAAILEALAQLESRLAAPGSGLRLARIAGGFQLTTNGEFRSEIRRLLAPRREEGLSDPALEALSVIAYRQPVTLPELNEIRGVNSQSVVATLMKHRLVRARGRKAVVGRPLLYGTTKEFLERFGLDRVEDLPDLAEFPALPESPPNVPAEGGPPGDTSSGPPEGPPADPAADSRRWPPNGSRS